MSALHVSVHKDIGEYTEKVVGKLSLRTLVCVTGGLLTSIAVAAFFYLVLQIEVSYVTLPVMAASMPFWLAGFWRPRGMKAEEFLPLWWAHISSDDRLVYISGPSLIQEQLIEKVPAKADRRASRLARKKGAELYEPQRHGYWLDGYRKPDKP
ncbi:MAG: PrgI family protein [Atopobiaceae bacterium]|nr:PrgI family protein [Atopobiaceae bacterium]